MNHEPPIDSNATSDDRSLLTGHQSQVRPTIFSSDFPIDDAKVDEITLFDVAIVLAKHKRLVMGLPFFAAAVTAIVTTLMTPIYTATTKILPPQNQQSTAAAMLGQLGALGGGAGTAFGIKNPAELYVGMLKSRTVADGLIETFELMKRYNAKIMTDARQTLESNTKVAAGKDGIITIDVDDGDPKIAADIANAYVDELMKLTSVLAVTEAGQRRVFLERQLLLAKNNLLQAESSARSALNRGGIAMVDEQGKSMVAATAALRAQVAAKEVQLGAMQSFATERNPEYLQASRELRALRQQIAKMEGAGGPDTNVVTGGRNTGMQNVALLRDVRYHEVLFELLSKQYEVARIDEAKEGTVIQVLDKAIEPQRKSKPQRTLIVVVVALLAGFVAVVWAFLSEAKQRLLNDPARAGQLAVLKRYL